MWKKNVLETIGNTPMIQLNKVSKGLPGTILAKVDYFNPGNSIKDRMALKMVEVAEQEGKLKPGGTIIEGTSGNTGMGLALAACVKGYKCIFVTTDKQSKEKVDILKAVGAEVIVCPTNVVPDDPRSYYSVAKRLGKEIPNSMYMNQYDNLANRQAHYESTGPEIWEQTEGKITHLVCTAGTGGTITGTAMYLKEKNPNIQVWAIDVYGSLLTHYYQTGEVNMDYVHPYISEGFAWNICEENGFTPTEFSTCFQTCLSYLADKKKFRETIRQKTFGSSTTVSVDMQLDVVKQALTAISFGARKHKHGWIDQSGKEFNPAIPKIIANETARMNFYACQEAVSFMDENKDMDAIITEYAKQQWPELKNDTELQSASGRISNSKLMSYLYQQSESIVMDIVRKEVKAVYKTVLANVHDAIYINQKLHSADKQRIELLMQRKTGLQFWQLDEEKISGYKGISDEVRKQEREHKAFMQQEEQRAQGYKSIFA